MQDAIQTSGQGLKSERTTNLREVHIIPTVLIHSFRAE